MKNITVVPGIEDHGPICEKPTRPWSCSDKTGFPDILRPGLESTKKSKIDLIIMVVLFTIFYKTMVLYRY